MRTNEISRRRRRSDAKAKELGLVDEESTRNVPHNREKDRQGSWDGPDCYRCTIGSGKGAKTLELVAITRSVARYSVTNSVGKVIDSGEIGLHSGVAKLSEFKCLIGGKDETLLRDWD